MLTFWLTHLYSRCTRAVSLATPAYYAHWAAKRGKHYLNAGAFGDQLDEICGKWLNKNHSMFFL